MARRKAEESDWVDAEDREDERAMAAYWRFGDENQDIPRKPVVMELAEKRYVVLHNGRVLAVYRVREPDGRLKRLKRWPKALEDRIV